MPDDTKSVAKQSPPPTSPLNSGGWLEAAATLLTGAVLMCRLLTPTEAITGATLQEGATLWIAQMALLAVIVWSIAAYRSGGLAWRFDRVDAAVLLLVAGHALSALWNWSGLDGRAACNVLCEWCGLSATWLLLLRRLLMDRSGRRQLLIMYLAAGTALSTLGIWQHLVDIPGTRNAVERWEREWSSLHERGRPSEPRAAAEWDRAVHRLQVEMDRAGVPTEDGARKMWEDRVKRSSEPYGFFALANTFAGLLLVALLLAVSSLIQAAEENRRRSAIAIALVTVPLAYCLVLTKSRTAFVGALVSLSLLTLPWLRRHTERRRAILWLGSALGILAALAAAASATGGLDQRVVLESFKSLQYRGEYWVGTWRMMTASGFRWLAGIGAGNFRPSYLEFKLPEASEEIADPHNLVLDVWANGGLMALIGLGVLCLAGLRPLWRNPRQTIDFSQPVEPVDHKPRRSARSHGARMPVALPAPLYVGGAMAFGCVLFVGGADDRMLPVALVWLCALAVWNRLVLTECPATIPAIAFAGLAIHLSGAGGMEMPAIVQTALWLAAWAATSEQTATAPSMPTTRRSAGLTGVVAGVLYLACWLWGLAPVLQSGSLLASGDAALSEGRVEQARRDYRAAATADPLGHAACNKLAELALRDWLTGARTADEDFDRCLEWSRQALDRFPRDLTALQTIGQAYLIRYEKSREPRHARQAADAFTQAVDFYPNSAHFQALSAEALWKADEKGAAAAFAERALELNDISGQRGHLDKLLPEQRVLLLRRIATEER